MGGPGAPSASLAEVDADTTAPGRRRAIGRRDENRPGSGAPLGFATELAAGDQAVRDRTMPPNQAPPRQPPAPERPAPASMRQPPAPVRQPPAAREAVAEDAGIGAGTAKRPRTAPTGVSKKARRPGRQTRNAAAGGKARNAARRPAGKSGKGVRRVPRTIMVLCACLLAAAAGAVGYLVLVPQAAHVVTVPASVGSFTKSPTVDRATAQALRSKVVGGAAGEVKNVVAAVYEQTTGPGTSQGPQIVVFIGGNLTGGGSAGEFISGFMTQLRGSFTTSPGRLGGQAACAPGRNGGPAECAWADNDTFGVIVSATLDAAGLANEMRMMRSLVEHQVK